MNINEKNAEVVIDALVAKIKSLEIDIWWRDEQIAKLKGQIGEKVGDSHS